VKTLSQLHITHTPLLKVGEKIDKKIEYRLFNKSPTPININGTPKTKSYGDLTFKLIRYPVIAIKIKIKLNNKFLII
jgi:hypothetical protein